MKYIRALLIWIYNLIANTLLKAKRKFNGMSTHGISILVCGVILALIVFAGFFPIQALALMVGIFMSLAAGFMYWLIYITVYDIRKGRF